MKELVLTLLADDKPGIVENISAVVVENGGSWLESRMNQMAGKFAGIVRVSCEDSDLSRLRDALTALERSGIRIIVEEAEKRGAINNVQFGLTVTANDRPGIVNEVSVCLSRMKINIEDLHTVCTSAAMSSGLLFTATFKAVVPLNVKIEEIILALEDLSDDLMVDVDPE